jgi:hypothetical protein
MGELTLQPGEKFVAAAQAQLAEGFPQTAGDLYVTSQRLVLEPNQLASLGFGKRWEVSLSRIRKVEPLGRFQGGTFVGAAGKKLVVHLDNASTHTFSFYWGSDIDSFLHALEKQIQQTKGDAISDRPKSS